MERRNANEGTSRPIEGEGSTRAIMCRALCAELAGETISLRDIMRTRNRRRRDLRHTLQARARTVEALLAAHRGDRHIDVPEVSDEAVMPPAPTPADVPTPRLKRYIHE